MPQRPPIHHVGYVVEDLGSAAAAFSATHGAGPFLAMMHLRFDEVSYLGGPARYDHSSAFGRWGPILVELTQVHFAEPPEFRDALVAPRGGVGHVAWLAESLDDEVERLKRAGFTPFHAGRTGPACAVWLDGGPLLGHPVEVLARCDELLGFYERVRKVAEGWDGSDPLRVIDPPA
ncbi:MAG TPA: VOC family protein [Solirubrobacteraceae bacterium]|nr:VOC family protein [Solirubrobacteraceae bacterium]